MMRRQLERLFLRKGISRRGHTILEYVVVVLAVLGGLWVMGNYIHHSIQGYYRKGGESFANLRQHDPHLTRDCIKETTGDGSGTLTTAWYSERCYNHEVQSQKCSQNANPVACESGAKSACMKLCSDVASVSCADGYEMDPATGTCKLSAKCTGTHPGGGAVACSDDKPTEATAYTLKADCSSPEVKCEYKCPSGKQPSGSLCVCINGSPTEDCSCPQYYHTDDTGKCVPNMCKSPAPAHATACPGALDELPTDGIEPALVEDETKCGGAKCQYFCSPYYHHDATSKACAANICPRPTPNFSALHAVSCLNAETPGAVAAGTSWIFVAACDDTHNGKCEYTCMTGYTLEGGVCVPSTCRGTLPEGATECSQQAPSGTVDWTPVGTGDVCGEGNICKYCPKPNAIENGQCVGTCGQCGCTCRHGAEYQNGDPCVDDYCDCDGAGNCSGYNNSAAYCTANPPSYCQDHGMCACCGEGQHVNLSTMACVDNQCDGPAPDSIWKSSAAPANNGDTWSEMTGGCRSEDPACACRYCPAKNASGSPNALCVDYQKRTYCYDPGAYCEGVNPCGDPVVCSS